MVNYYLETPKWDSFRIQIPANQVLVLGMIGDVFERSLRSKTSGEQFIEEGEFTPLSQADVFNGISLRVGKRNVLRGNLPSIDCFEFQINAKMLGERYFEGITQTNLIEIYEYIMSKKIVYVEWEHFIEGKILDIDCCYDVVCDIEQAQKVIRKVYQSIKYEKKKYVKDPYLRETNTGIEFSERQRQKPTAPNLRIYYKGAEMENKPVLYPNQNNRKTYGEFNDVYFNGMHHPIIRLERNFKNKDHFRYEKLNIETLNDIFNLDLQHLKNIMLTSVKKYYIDVQVRLRSDLQLGPVEYLLSVLIDEKIKDGADISYWESICEGYGGGYTQRSRLKNKIKSFVDRPEYKEIVASNNAVGEVWKKLGLE